MELKIRAVFATGLLFCCSIVSQADFICYNCYSRNNSRDEIGCTDIVVKSDDIDTCTLTGDFCTKILDNYKEQIFVSLDSCFNETGPRDGCLDLPERKFSVCTCRRDWPNCNSAKTIISSAWLIEVAAVLSMSTAICN